ncbi:hypothetical protein VPH35_135432 [Triticum aestivum]
MLSSTPCTTPITQQVASRPAAVLFLSPALPRRAVATNGGWTTHTSASATPCHSTPRVAIGPGHQRKSTGKSQLYPLRIGALETCGAEAPAMAIPFSYLAAISPASCHYQ